MSTDELIGQNLQKARDSVSQTELAQRMRERGHKWTQPTVVAVEKGERPLRMAEAIDAAEILGVDLYDLVRYPRVLTFHNELQRLIDAHKALLDAAIAYELARVRLLTEAADYEREEGRSVRDDLAEWPLLETPYPLDELQSARMALEEYALGHAPNP